MHRAEVEQLEGLLDSAGISVNDHKGVALSLVDRVGSLVANRDRIRRECDKAEATVRRLVRFYVGCDTCCEVYEGRCRKGREVPIESAIPAREMRDE